MSKIESIIGELQQCPNEFTDKSVIHWMFMVLAEIALDELGLDETKSLISEINSVVASPNTYLGVTITEENGMFRAKTTGIEIVEFTRPFDISSNNLDVLRDAILMKVNNAI